MTDWQREGLKLGLEVSSIIASPLILAVFLGKYLDKKFNTAPYIFLTMCALSFIFTIYLLNKKTKNYIKRMDSIDKQDGKK